MLETPVYKKPWFWVIIAILFFAIVNTEEDEKIQVVQKEVVKEEVVKEEVVKTKLPSEYRSALSKAKSYSDTLSMSKRAIYDQLTSTLEKFSKESAQYAVDNVDVAWSLNALDKAKSYQEHVSMSPKAIYRQLIEFEKFTKDQASYAIKHLDD